MNTTRQFRIQCDDPSAEITIVPLAAEDGIDLYRIAVKLPEKTVPPKITIAWEEDMVNHLHVWTPLCGTHHLMHQWFGPTRSDSRFHFGAPLLATIGDSGRNRFTVALSDPLPPTALTFAVKDLDQQNKVGYTAVLFSNTYDALKSYETLLRIDTRPLLFCETVQQVYPWWKSLGWEIPTPPAAAEDALYSSWYNFHQAPRQDKLLADLKIAAELGFKTVILDDGWQFPGPSSGDYALCGEWHMSEDKFPDFKRFCDDVHALGMKLMVWFAVPFVGVQSPLFETWRDKMIFIDYAHDNFGMNTGTLDPRYPEVRAFIISNYKRFLIDYDIDGFKFDFIDSFAHWDPPAYNPDGMDIETTGEATRRLLTEIEAELSAIKPELLYEYRQNYIGPAINRFGNMLRVGDCAYESLANRIGIVDLRLLGYPVAVHADMLFWAPEESIKLCSRQLLNILFGVPQISVILADSTEEQKAFLRAYLSYWTQNRDLILHGTFRAYSPEQGYTRITAETDERVITVLHNTLPYVWDGRACDIHHNGGEDGIIFENPGDDTLTAEISYLFGETVIDTVTVAPHTMTRLPVPQTAMVRITKA